MTDQSAPGLNTSDASAGTGSGPSPLPKAPRSPRLDTSSAVRIELGRVYRTARAGLCDWQTATRAATLHRMLGEVDLAELADRVAALEARRP